MIALTTDTNAQGIKKIGFNIIGNPNVTGSEIPKNAGNTLIFPTVFIILDFEKHNNIAIERHDPTPPITTKYTQNDSVNIADAATPDAC